MDTRGNILKMTDEMKNRLNEREWTKSLSKTVTEGILIVLLSDH